MDLPTSYVSLSRIYPLTQDASGKQRFSLGMLGIPFKMTWTFVNLAEWKKPFQIAPSGDEITVFSGFFVSFCPQDKTLPPLKILKFKIDTQNEVIFERRYISKKHFFLVSMWNVGGYTPENIRDSRIGSTPQVKVLCLDVRCSGSTS